jgi:3-oxoacyl-[acyl-carrier protein] reductase
MSQRVALIPGGARGIGREIALRLAERGWHVAIGYRTSRDDAETAAGEAERRGGRAITLQADVATADGSESLVQAAQAWAGRIDALVYAAGPFHRIPVMEESPERWRATMAANLDGFFYLSRLLGPAMGQRGWGRMLAFTIANAERIVGQSTITAHYVSKVGLLALVRALARALAGSGVTVNAVAPGVIDTGGLPPDELQRLLPSIPAGRLGTPADAAAAALWLLSDEASYVTGTHLHVSGGWGV